ncbi:MAG TPA: hypothetical protein VKB83_01800, partial [Nitrosopumilaceae archaeon]|nr:hypothetical protein [Nitrosopumilaceae archaeon]
IVNEEQIHVISHHNYLMQTCSLCKKKMLLSEGDMIYGDKWYHNSCWNLVEQRNTKCSISRK